MDYIEKLELQTEEIEEVETLEEHSIINNTYSVNKYNGHNRNFLALDGEYDDGYSQLKEVYGASINCIVSREVKEAREDINGVSHEKLKDRIDSEVNGIMDILNLQKYKIQTVTANSTIADDCAVVLVNTYGVSVTLPPAKNNIGRIIEIVSMGMENYLACQQDDNIKTTNLLQKRVSIATSSTTHLRSLRVVTDGTIWYLLSDTSK